MGPTRKPASRTHRFRSVTKVETTSATVKKVATIANGPPRSTATTGTPFTTART